LTAVIDTALCVGAGGSSGSLADKPIVRNAKGQLLIPASQLKGRLRHECEKLARGLGWQIFESPAAEKLCPTEDQVELNFVLCIKLMDTEVITV
jgi:CRISPR/Cas system CSM-associated protein Csm3 (group 7 of RAMP superfamily)